MIEPRAVAVVGMGAILPDAFDVQSFWRNILSARYSISEVDPARWEPDLYYSPDPTMVDKTYSKIGGWVRGFHFDPLKLGIPIPPRVLESIDEYQQWAIAASLQAMVDYGYPKRQYDPNRVAVILGNSMGGEHHYLSTLRIHLPDYQQSLRMSPAFQHLPPEVQKALLNDMQANIHAKIPVITEDTMPGELSNIIAGRVANVFNFGGPNFVTDAACASSLAAVQAAIEGLVNRQYDLVLSGGVDRSMGVESFVKFSKIGALSPDGSRPYADGANGFVMGEGAGVFMLKRLAEAEQDGDKIYAVIRGIGSSSDGKGKGITAPNPAGQQRAIERAWKNAGVSPSSVGLVEGHGTSTKVGDFAELTSLNSIFGQFGIPTGRIGLGSVKSNFGHLKSAAGAAGMMKVILALHEKVLPPSVNFTKPNSQIDFAHIPFSVITEQRPWPKPEDEIRRACVSAFGFGGTNFHMVIEEHIPGLLTSDTRSFPGVELKGAASFLKPESAQPIMAEGDRINLAAYGGLLFLNGHNVDELKQRLAAVIAEARTGHLPSTETPSPEALGQPERLAIEYTGAEELLKRGEKALKAFDNPALNAWPPLTAQGIYRGSGKAGKVAFLFPGQGSQYVNMLRELCNFEPVVAKTFREADDVMTPILGRPLTSFIFVEGDEASQAKAEVDLRNTTITQPAMLTANIALMRLMNKFGFKPDLVIGHSLGEYAALVAAGVLSFAEALQVVSARGREMAKVSWEDNGCMAAVSGPLQEVERILKTIDGYVVIANINSPVQSVIGGATKAVEAAIAAFQAAGIQAVKIPVSHAFHTKIVAPASAPLRRIIAGMSVQRPQLPIVANVTGELYPTGREEILDLLADQVASPVQMVKSMQTLYREGVRIFVEVGPKRVLNALACDNFRDRSDVSILATNHPRKGALITFKEALCGLYAAGVNGIPPQPSSAVVEKSQPVHIITPAILPTSGDGRQPLTGSVVVSGAGLGLPGKHKHVFDDENVQRLLRGESLIEALPIETRNKMLEKRVTRLNKSEAGATMDTIEDLEQTIKLAGQSGAFNLAEEFGVPVERVDALDVSTQLAIAAGVEALRDAGIPLVMAYRQTSKGTFLPKRWMLPEALADETGVIFASAFPGLQRMADEADHFYEFKNLTSQVEELRHLLPLVPSSQTILLSTLNERIGSLEARLAEIDYHFDRRFIFRILAMGHSQFAEYIGARGPNTHVNAACASTTHAVAVAEDWIRAGRCRRVVVIAGDDVSDGNLATWIGTGLLASGATTTEGDPRQAILPFDRRRNGMIMGMGAAALVVEAEDAVCERGMRGICEVLASQIANSAFHGTRLDVEHVSVVMEHLIAQAEQRFGLRRSEIAPQIVFVSHETYTPARGGSASAEIRALRQAFGVQASKVVIANTKGFTGHSMGVGVEDVLAVKALEYSIVPPIANIHEGFEPDPELGDLNLSRGGHYPVEFSLRLGAGFGSQIAMTLMRKIPGEGDRINHPVYDRWLGEITGYEKAELEVIQHTLRITHTGPPTKSPAISHWQLGQGPTAWASQGPTSVPALAEIAIPASQVATTGTQAGTTELVSVSKPASVTKSTSEEEIKGYILSITSEKTGYPAEMLDLELDLEADLGIDTVKQAELFATIRTHYGIPRREDLRLSDYNTLTKVIRFVKEGTASTTVAAPLNQPEHPAAQPVQSPTSRPSTEQIKAYILSITSEKTGYPSEMLDLELDLEADLGIDTVKQAELFATIRTHYGIPRREDLRLSDYNNLTKVIKFVEDALSSGARVATAVQVAVGKPSPFEQTPTSTPTSTPVEATYDEIKSYILAVVSEKTGYPAEMLDLDLDLEADLGIDTVKQAELFATIRTNYGIPRREDLRLSDYNNLNKVILFVSSALTSAQPESVAPAVLASAPQAASTPMDQGQAASAIISSNLDFEAVKTQILAMVSEKTGYPPDMLDLDLDLEADLGIDTVKQAELFASIRTLYGIPRREDLRLSDYNTLAKTIQFVLDPNPAAVPAPQPILPTEVPAQTTVVEPPAQVIELPEETRETKEPAPMTIKRRVPVPVLRPRLDLCTSTGVTLEAGLRVLVVNGQDETGKALARRLRNRKVKVLSLDSAAPAEISEKLAKYLAEGPINGVYFLPALDVEPALAETTSEQWQIEMGRRVYTLFNLMKSLPGEPFLVSATRMGGLHGYTPQGATAPMGGAVSGFTKAIALERPDSFAKVVDFSIDAPAATIAGRLIEETLADPGVVEVGWEEDRRFSIALIEKDLPTQKMGFPDENSVYLVTGGSGGIIAPVVSDLAKNCGGTFYLVGVEHLPERDDPDLSRLKSDRNGLKKDLMARLSTPDNKATPAQVDQRLTMLDRCAATLETLDKVTNLGGNAYYIFCDVTKPESVKSLVDQILEKEGHVDILLHAAGLERSRKLENKPVEEFKLILSVKADGFFNLYKAFQEKNSLPASLLAFTSIAGRFGNSGQTDYSAANDFLCKVFSALAAQHPGIRAQVLDWGAWADVGMASRGYIPALMERAGIDMLKPEVAAPLVRQELQYNPGSGEAVLAGSLGVLADSRHPNGGLDLALANKALTEGNPIHVMLSRATGFDLQQGILLEADLDPQIEPFLRDHSMNGVPLLPGVMGIEGFSVAAKHVSSVLGSGKSGYEVANLEDVSFLTPFKFYRGEPRRITWKAQVLRESNGLVAHVTLESDLALKTNRVEHKVHFSGKVHLEPQHSQKEMMVTPPEWNGSYTVQAEDIYRLYFHGPAFQVLDGVQLSGNTVLGKLSSHLPPFTSGGLKLLSTPVLVELCLQTAGIWEAGKTGTLCLPRSIGYIHLYSTKVDGIPVYAEVTPGKDATGQNCFDARVVDAKGHLFLELRDYRTTPLPYTVEEKILAPMQALVAERMPKME